MKYIIYFANVIVLLFLFYCKDQGVSPDRENYIIPDKNISYYDDLLPMFEGKCGFQCHSSTDNPDIVFIPFSNKEDFINFQISNDEVLVDTVFNKIDPVRAPLYKIVTEDYRGIKRMPPFPRLPLTDNQINGIKEWIAEGCPD